MEKYGTYMKIHGKHMERNGGSQTRWSAHFLHTLDQPAFALSLSSARRCVDDCHTRQQQQQQQQQQPNNFRIFLALQFAQRHECRKPENVSLTKLAQGGRLTGLNLPRAEEKERLGLPDDP